jgi:hypothetical protein
MENTMTPETLICIFCSATVADEMPVCLACDEYKGVMTIWQYAHHYPEMFADDFGDLEIPFV